MEFGGKLALDVPRAQAVQACHDPALLQLLLPVPGTLTRLDDARFDLLLTPETPLFPAALPGRLVITPVEPGRRYHIEATAKMPLMGGISLVAELEFDGDDSACTLTCTGVLDGKGMLGRLVKAKESSIRARLQNGLDRLGRRIGKGHPPPGTKGP